MNKTMKNLICLLLVGAMAMFMVACAASSGEETTAGTQQTTAAETTQAAPDETLAQVDLPAGEITYLNLYIGTADGNMRSVSAYDNGDGTVYVEYAGDEKKVGYFEPSVFADMTLAFADSGLAALNGTDEYTEGGDYCSMYVEFSGGDYLTANFSGVVDDGFQAGYNAMEAWFAQLTADLPVYVPQAMVQGEVNPDALAAMQEIVNNSGMDGLDGMAISDIPLDEYFAVTAGVSSTDGITNGTMCAAMMSTTPYSLVILTLENEEDAGFIRSDLENCMDWQKWVCVAPESALIAQKGNMVLCLMGSGNMFSQTVTAIENAGWVEMETFHNLALA